VPAQVDCAQLLLEAAGQPLTAIDIVETDRMGQRSEMNRDFLAMIGGSDTPLAVAEKWLAYDIAEVLAWFSRVINTLIAHQMGGSPIDEQWQPFINGVSTQRLYKLSDQVLLLNAQLQRGGNPNKQLALEQLMLETCDVFTSRAVA
jgi:DNA polymerase-3 subunit delta'